jgi:SAM-dependent methyltransferase
MTWHSYDEIDWYDTPRYYDIVFAADIKLEADFLEAMRRRFSMVRGRRVLEPACGSGRLVEEMARRGYSVTGFDGNPNALAYARERLAHEGLHARLFQAELATFGLPPRFDLAHCLVSTFKYLLSERAARAHLRRVSGALKPGGIYVLGFHLSEYGTTSKTRERWVGRRGGTEVVCNTQFWPPDRRHRLERVRARLTVDDRGAKRRLETNWMFRTYSARQVRSLIRSVRGFEHVGTYDFTYRAEQPRTLNDEQLDCVLVLRKGRG